MNDHAESTPSVSVIGLGSMGSGIARVFLAAGCRVSVWNRSRAKVDALVSDGAVGCDTPADALKANTHVVVCLTDYSAWRKIIEDHDLQEHFEGTCLIQLTTGMIDDVQWHASLVAEHGGHIADGAVMCYPNDLGTSTASLLMAGRPDVLESCDPLLSMLASQWTNLGENITKPTILSRALMVDVGMTLIGIVNGAALARAGDISLDVFMQHTNNVGEILTAEKSRLIEAIRDGNTEETQASITSWGEGQKAVRSVAQSLGTNLVFQNAVKTIFEEAEQLGLGNHDLAALAEVFSPQQA
ncbi:MAG: NAD(P)-binding domain-containing protein [Phycisphaerales bacterium]|nr:NAD(P)-binding domain-containing protein [Phycisphaerales bacterium]